MEQKKTAGRLPEAAIDACELKQLKKKDKQIDHQSFKRPLDFLG